MSSITSHNNCTVKVCLFVSEFVCVIVCSFFTPRPNGPISHVRYKAKGSLGNLIGKVCLKYLFRSRIAEGEDWQV